ncbi:hypothetical protein DP107_05340 [Haloglomus irregulare]|uniref:DUF8009 domain-containing protein n=1 Tax=Haloglomus irregulare TaxID=2234134 RepID=A0A554ND17_9EURY|nr:hypothetical protein [Haloglomus irregulare]TSD15274.1 hypothetical protein DP107_05340 [Haloglomus irregulare]
MPEADDPTVIDTLAITAEDLIAALEANARRDAGAVLRVTPPFSGRMRARLHLAGAEGGYDDTPRPIHIPPQRLLADDAPAFPSVDATEDDLRSNPETEYTPERHRERHEGRVETWRDAVRDHVGEAATIETDGGAVAVTVTLLG